MVLKERNPSGFPQYSAQLNLKEGTGLNAGVGGRDAEKSLETQCSIFLTTVLNAVTCSMFFLRLPKKRSSPTPSERLSGGSHLRIRILICPSQWILRSVPKDRFNPSIQGMPTVEMISPVI